MTDGLFRSQRGATLIEYTIATSILFLGLVAAILLLEFSLTDKINEGRCTYNEYDLPDPRSSGGTSSC